MKVRWVYHDRAEPLVRDEEGAGTPLKVFSDREKAEAYRRRLHQAARKKAIPFQHGAPFGQRGALPSSAAYTSLSDEDFLRLLAEVGLEPPELSQPDEPDAAASSYAVWCEWWYEGAKGWPPDVQDRLWAAPDRVTLFEVVAVSAEL